MLTIGTHMSIAGGLGKTAENVVAMEANTMQIFSRNPGDPGTGIPPRRSGNASRNFAGITISAPFWPMRRIP